MPPGLGLSLLGRTPLGNTFPAAGVPTPRRLLVGLAANLVGTCPPLPTVPAAAWFVPGPRAAFPLAPVER